MWNNQEYESWDDSTKDETPRNINLNKSKKLFLKKVNNLPNLETIDLSYAGFVFIGELINNLHALTTLDIGIGDRIDLFVETRVANGHQLKSGSLRFRRFKRLQECGRIVRRGLQVSGQGDRNDGRTSRRNQPHRKAGAPCGPRRDRARSPPGRHTVRR